MEEKKFAVPGDFRTFVIALLTSVIVVAVYHFGCGLIDIFGCRPGTPAVVRAQGCVLVPLTDLGHHRRGEFRHRSECRRQNGSLENRRHRRDHVRMAERRGGIDRDFGPRAGRADFRRHGKELDGVRDFRRNDVRRDRGQSDFAPRAPRPEGRRDMRRKPAAPRPDNPALNNSAPTDQVEVKNTVTAPAPEAPSEAVPPTK